MYINRYLTSQLKENLFEDNKLVVLYGPRQVGKTTLAKKLISEVNLKTLQINAEQTKYQSVLSSQDVSKLEGLIAGYKLLFIDEAQYIDNIGINLKLIYDNFSKDLKVLVTGSSSFDLANKLSESLTGRAWKYILYPISFLELKDKKTDFELKDQLEDRLVFGSYPEVFKIKNFKKRQQYLEELVNSYLFKDIFTFASIKYHSKIKQLLKLIAFQVGSEVSIAELATQLGINRNAVENYLNLLEKSFVIFRLSGFSRNLRKEVTKMDKIYFYDLGIRNAIVDNFKLLDSRKDIGQLWENFLIIERLKQNSYKKNYCSSYFWRLHSGAELDYLEEHSGKLFAYEFKWGAKTAKAPKSFLRGYKNSSYKLINKDNFLDFIT
jgi:uncharacterized protein